MAEIIKASPNLRKQDYLAIAREITDEITFNDGARSLRLAMAIGCLCRELEKRGAE